MQDALAEVAGVKPRDHGNNSGFRGKDSLFYNLGKEKYIERLKQLPASQGQNICDVMRSDKRDSFEQTMSQRMQKYTSRGVQ
jgi:hypothetical protein